MAKFEEMAACSGTFEVGVSDDGDYSNEGAGNDPMEGTGPSREEIDDLQAEAWAATSGQGPKNRPAEAWAAAGLEEYPDHLPTVAVMTTGGPLYVGREVRRDASGIALVSIYDDLWGGELIGESTPSDQPLFIPWSSVVSVLTGVETDEELRGWAEMHRLNNSQRVFAEMDTWGRVYLADGRACEGRIVPADAGVLVTDRRDTTTDQDGNRHALCRFVPWTSVVSVEWREFVGNVQRKKQAAD